MSNKCMYLIPADAPPCICSPTQTPSASVAQRELGPTFVSSPVCQLDIKLGDAPHKVGVLPLSPPQPLLIVRGTRPEHHNLRWGGPAGGQWGRMTAGVIAVGSDMPCRGSGDSSVCDTTQASSQAALKPDHNGRQSAGVLTSAQNSKRSGYSPIPTFFASSH